MYFGEIDKIFCYCAYNSDVTWSVTAVHLKSLSLLFQLFIQAKNKK